VLAAARLRARSPLAGDDPAIGVPVGADGVLGKVGHEDGGTGVGVAGEVLEGPPRRRQRTPPDRRPT